MSLLTSKEGAVAQLNRASDYGSEGFGFESQQRHNGQPTGLSREEMAGRLFSCLAMLMAVAAGLRGAAMRPGGASGPDGRDVGWGGAVSDIQKKP